MSKIFEKLEQLSPEEQGLLEKKIFSGGGEDFNIFPLSTSQERLWFLSQFEPDDPSYNISVALKIKGFLDIEIFEQSFRQIIERHEILRTSYHSLNGKPVQLINEEFDFGIETIDLSADENTESKALEIALSNARKIFNLTESPLIRVSVIKLSEESYLCAVTIHHIAADGWSMSVLVRELTELYKSYLEHRSPRLSELPIQYADFAVWEKENITAENLAQETAYWKKQLGGHLPALNLPTDNHRPAIQNTDGKRFPLSISPELTEKLKLLAKNENATLFMILLAGLKSLFYRYTNQEDICIGASIAGRTIAETENLIGFFLNTLVLRSKPNGKINFSEFLAQVRKISLEAFENQAVPVEILLDTLEVERNASRNPLFQVLFILQNTPAVDLKLGAAKIEEVEIDTQTSKFDLTFDIAEKNEKIEGWIEYATALFDEKTIARLAGHYVNLLEQIAINPQQKLGEIDFLADAEKQSIEAFQGSKQTAATDLCLHRFVTVKAVETPDAPAVKFEEKELTYLELEKRANRLANYLSEKGIRTGDFVGLSVSRSLERIISILAVLKLGAAYVPIEPNSPSERIDFIIENSQIGVLLTNSETNLSNQNIELIDLEAESVEIANFSDEFVETNLSTELPAYVIYTSGSTGKPKGVVVQHNAIVNFVNFARDFYQFQSTDRVLQFASYSFDASLEEIFPTFAAGALLVLRNEEMISTVETFFRNCEKEKITVLDLPTAYWNELVSTRNKGNNSFPDSVRLVIIGGEKVSVKNVNRWRELGTEKIRLVNSYGPTETTVVTVAGEVECQNAISETKEISLGKPVSNSQSFVLDENLNRVPIGVTGELYIGGKGLAIGYIHDARLTAEKFVPNPFSNIPGERLYKTGDAARFLADGSLEYRGRTDDQVKIRGFRVEPGEIENALLANKCVKSAAVISKEHEGFNRLVAFYTENENNPVENAELREFLRKTLPDFMIPSAFVKLERMPLTGNGKIDKKTLQRSEHNEIIENRSVELPATETEIRLAEIWSEILQTGQIGRNDNFFDLGGHSLLGTRVISHVRHKFGTELPLRSLFEAPTLAGLAKQIENFVNVDTKTELPPIKRLEHEELVRLSFAQERLWFLQLLHPEKYAYNVLRPIRFKGNLNIPALERALTKLIARHETYRTIFPKINGLGFIKVNEPQTVGFNTEILEQLPENLREEKMREIIHKEGQTHFNVVDGPLWRLRFLKMSEADHLLLFSEHHLVHDGWTEGVLVTEFLHLYQSEAANRPEELKPLPISYRDFAVWQRNCFENGLFDHQIEYWKEKLSGKLPELALPTDMPRSSVETFKGDTYTRILPFETLQKLREFARENDVTLYMILLAAFSILLHRYSRQDEILIATSVAGRNKFELESLIGFFVNTLPMRNDLAGDPTFDEYLQRTKKLCFEAFANQDVPFEKIVEIIQPDRTLSKQSLFQVMMVLHNAESPDLILPGLEVQSMRVHNETSKFDLLFHLREEPGGLRLAMEYSTELFREDTIDRMLEHFENLLLSALENKRENISKLKLIGEAERTKLLSDWNQTEIEYPSNELLASRFEKQVDLSPDSVAVRFREELLTYRELDERANQIAGKLSELGIKPEIRVGICLKRSLDMICTVLAVVKCGGVYVPLDSTYPNERLTYILEDSQVKILVTEESLLSSLPEKLPTLFVLDREKEEISTRPKQRLKVRGDIFNLVYITYTSGSTGKPKGIGMTQHSLLNLLDWMLANTQLPEKAVTLQFASLSFDVSFQDIFSTLLSGGSLVLITEDERQDIKGLAKIIAREGVHRLFIPAVALQQLAEGFCNLGAEQTAISKIIAGSEQLQITPKIAQMFSQNPQAHLHNEYGPSEAHVVTELEMQGKPDEWVKRPSVGKPISNTKIYILDQHFEPTPTCVPGELYIGGYGVARAYLTQPALTSEKFIPDPFSKKHGARMYRTGDMARFLADGNIEFLGRADFQLKIRGFRIEPGEIEIVLSQSPFVSEAVVTAFEFSEFDKRLIAYVVPKNGATPEPAQIREFLKEKLPDYMIPSSFIVLDKIPLNTNGKVDRKNLPLPDKTAAFSGREYVAPETELEKFVSAVWMDVTGLEKIGTDDNFFDIGGHSLLAMQVVSQLSDSLETEIPLRLIFEFPTIRQLCGELQTFDSNGGDLETIARYLNQINELSDDEAEAMLNSLSA
ncbi:MAG: amino acid adenylation domain-containing protein [Pyrinomonadaceae bacterium]|nr:amino acid adenylation domain-containing protein [Pyrinomonadaceae bacterium]